ncbi:MAG: hypothetical protein B6D58_00485 [candidate division Zixibacteria bacterium 4484_95]|nr:MAG: hypothetical protein B6D58_00485 [candidate division Zixibacteria bacterium 4484_95]
MMDIDNNTPVCIALKEYAQVSPKLFQKLLLTYGNPSNIFQMTPEDISSMVGIKLEQAQKIIGCYKSLDKAIEMIDYLESLDISVISYFHEEYPELFRVIAEPPLVIYVKGDQQLLQDGGIAIVGTTSADQSRLRMAADFAKEFSKHGKTIISGLANGIDSAAHLGCLKNQGKTIAVLGCGHLNIYPEENIPLINLILESGTIISEHDIYADAIPGRLISRNRLISALADAVIVVQIGEEKRGELYTARAAIEQGKPLFLLDPDNKSDNETLLENSAIKIKGLEQIDEILEYVIR